MLNLLLQKQSPELLFSYAETEGLTLYCTIILQRIYGIESFDYTVIHLHDSTLAAYNDYSSPFQPSVSIK